MMGWDPENNPADRCVELQGELDRLWAEVAELLTFVKAYRDKEHPSYLWSLSTALLEKHAVRGSMSERNKDD